MINLGCLVLETEHLPLEAFVLEDAPAMYENWASDPENLNYVTWDAHTSSERTRIDQKRARTVSKNQILINGRSVSKHHRTG